MLGLSFQYLDGKILDCAAGPASFNANATLKGYRVTSCELLCRFTAEKPPTASARLTVETGGKVNRDRYVWKEIGSPTHTGEARMAAMRHFLEHASPGLGKGRYQAAKLPPLGFKYGKFA